MTDLHPTEPFSLTFEHRPGYLYAYVAGKHDNYDISKRYWTLVSDELRSSGYKKVLVEEDIVEAATMGDVFQLVSEFPGIGLLGIKIAFCDRHLDHADLNDFGALVGNNRGLQGAAFNDVEKAKEWLLSAGRSAA